MVEKLMTYAAYEGHSSSRAVPRPWVTFGSTRLKTSTVAATANTPSLNASARDFVTATTICQSASDSGCLCALPEPLGLLPVSARGHPAPAAGLVARVVVEGPTARRRAAELEPLPALLRHRRANRRHEPPD